MTGRRPDHLVRGERAVDELSHLARVADGRDAADREARMPAHELRVGLGNRLAEDRRQPLGIDAPRARGHDQHRAGALLRAEYERVRDLRHIAAEKIRRGARRARGAWQFDYLRRDTRT